MGEQTRICDNCGRTCVPDEQMYSIKVELFARAEPLVIEPEELLEDHMSKLADLVKEMETSDVEEATDQVHESYLFDLCAKCRRRLHHQFKLRARAKKQGSDS